MNTMDIALAARACAKAQALYEADADQAGRAVKAWHALDYATRHAYVDRAVRELEARVVRFPEPVQRIHPSELVSYAVRNIQNAITDLVNAANAAESLEDANELQTVISELMVRLQEVSQVAFHREQQFYPKGA